MKIKMPPPISRIINLLKIKLKEQKFQQRLPFLFFNNHSDSLLIIFSAFSGNKRRYNYVKGLRNLNIDKLYILDPFGCKGSYNMYENGSDYPERMTRELIDSVLSNHQYKAVYTAGSSKGGTCAIYFGLIIKADAIFAGASQFNLGSYVHRPDHEDIFLGMMGKDAGEEEALLLNKVMPTIMEKEKGTKSVLHILYSKNELTYERQIVDLLAQARKCDISVVEIEESFQDHDDVGKYFLPYVKRFFHID